MNAKKFLLAWIVAFVVTFLLSGLWHELLLGDFYRRGAADAVRETPNMLFVALGQIVLTLLMVIIYPIGYKGGSPAVEGIRFGVLIGLLWILPFGLIIHGIWKVSLTTILVDAAWHIVEEGAGGLVIGLIHGAGATAEPAAETTAPPSPEQAS